MYAVRTPPATPAHHLQRRVIASAMPMTVALQRLRSKFEYDLETGGDLLK